MDYLQLLTRIGANLLLGPRFSFATKVFKRRCRVKDADTANIHGKMDVENVAMSSIKSCMASVRLA